MPRHRPPDLRRVHRHRRSQPGGPPLVDPAGVVRLDGTTRRRRPRDPHGVPRDRVVGEAHLQLPSAGGVRRLAARVARRGGLPLWGAPIGGAGRAVVGAAGRRAYHGRVQRSLHLPLPELPPPIHRIAVALRLVHGYGGRVLPCRRRRGGGRDGIPLGDGAGGGPAVDASERR